MQGAPSGNAISKLLVLTMNAARASVQAMRCFLWSSPLRPGLAVLWAERQGGPPAAKVLAAVGGGSPRSSPDSSPVSSSELRKMSAQPRQSPSWTPNAHALQTGAGDGGGVCAGSAPPGGMPASKRCLVSHPWHQPPVTLPHQSHGPAPLKGGKRGERRRDRGGAGQGPRVKPVVTVAIVGSARYERS